MLETRILRELTLSNTVEGRPDHLSAGSGLVRRGDYIYVIGDDELDLAVFHLADSRPGELVRLFEGALPLELGERHRNKPDLEALTTLPPFKFNPYGALLALGSGGGETRSYGFVWSLDEDGSLRGFPRVVDLSGLYDFLKQHVTPEINIEGVAVAGDQLALFKRGNTSDGKNIVITLSLEEVMETLTTDFIVDASELLEVREYDLGEANGGKLDFTDGDSLPDGRMVFAAAAEVEDEEHPHGYCAGSVVGVIGTDGSVERIEPLAESSIKLEGVDAVLSDELIHVLMVSDADALEVPSPLMSSTLPA